MIARVEAPHVVVDWPQDQSTSRTAASDVLARYLLTLAMNMQDPGDDETFAVDIPYMVHTVTISELTKSLKALSETEGYDPITFRHVESNGARVYFRWHQNHL